MIEGDSFIPYLLIFGDIPFWLMSNTQMAPLIVIIESYPYFKTGTFLFLTTPAMYGRPWNSDTQGSIFREWAAFGEGSLFHERTESEEEETYQLVVTIPAPFEFRKTYRYADIRTPHALAMRAIGTSD